MIVTVVAKISGLGLKFSGVKLFRGLFVFLCDKGLLQPERSLNCITHYNPYIGTLNPKPSIVASVFFSITPI